MKLFNSICSNGAGLFLFFYFFSLLVLPNFSALEPFYNPFILLIYSFDLFFIPTDFVVKIKKPFNTYLYKSISEFFHLLLFWHGNRNIVVNSICISNTS